MSKQHDSADCECFQDFGSCVCSVEIRGVSLLRHKKISKQHDSADCECFQDLRIIIETKKLAGSTIVRIANVFRFPYHY